MVGFEFYSEETGALEHEIERLGLALGIDWSDEAAVQGLAREALATGTEDLAGEARRKGDYRLLAKAELFGLAAVMLRVLEKSAEAGFVSHGGQAWKAFGRALWNEAHR